MPVPIKLINSLTGAALLGAALPGAALLQEPRKKANDNYNDL
jgi:hypothetical protein